MEKEVIADRLVPLLDVADMEKTVSFYVDGLGFEKKSEWIKDGELRWCMLGYAGGASLMVQKSRPGETVGVGPSMYVFCNDALAFYDQVRARGIEAEEPFVGNGMHVVRTTDPDGYRFAFESPTDEPDTH